MMRLRLRRLCQQVIAGVIVVMIGDAEALRIYRFGGDDMPPPPEADLEGVEFIHRSWLDPVDDDLGGEVFQVDLSNGTIKGLRYDPNENIAPLAKGRGEGVRESTRQEDQEAAADGDLSTAWFPEQYLCATFDPNQVGSRRCGRMFHRDGIGYGENYMGIDSWTMGLGGFFFIDRVRIISGVEDEARIMKNFMILAAAGRTQSTSYGIASTTQVFNVVGEVRDNNRSIIDIEFSEQQPRFDFIQLQHAEHNKEWAVQEIEIYSRGFAERSSYVSEIIEFEDDTAWGDLKWAGRQEVGAEVRIQTRSGNTLDQNLYWQLTGRGERIQVADFQKYKRLKLGERGGTTYDRDNWTFWSAPYNLADSSGTPIVSQSPRRFFQFKVDVIPFNESGGELDFLEFRTSQPLASDLIGEVFPTKAQVAQTVSFTYYLQPFIAPNASGFDGVELSTSSILGSVTSVRIGERDWPFTVTPLAEDGTVLPSFPAHRLEVAFTDTKLTAADSGTPVEIDFDARVLRSGTTFDLRVLDTSAPLAVRQKVESGDANSLIEGNTISVETTANASSLLRAKVSPPVFTPNGDQVNDVAQISYDLLEIIGTALVTIEVSDLAGRVVCEVYHGTDPIGHYERSWDGKDNSGATVPPGVYVYQIAVDTDRDREAADLGVINVAY